MVAGRHRQRQTVRFSGLFTGTSPPLDEQRDKMIVGWGEVSPPRLPLYDLRGT
jgi:hypothetical protein